MFGCTGSTLPDIIIAAMEQAVGDGMQVINLSLGVDYDYESPFYPLSIMFDTLVGSRPVACPATVQLPT